MEVDIGNSDVEDKFGGTGRLQKLTGRNREKELESRRNRERVSELLEKMNFEVCCGVVWAVVWPEKKQRGGVGVERDDGTGRDF